MSEIVAGTGLSEFISQKNCMQVLGLTGRRFLELLRRDDAPPVVAVGKVRMVRRELISAYVERQRGEAPSEVGADGAAAVLAEVGCAPVPRRR